MPIARSRLQAGTASTRTSERARQVGRATLDRLASADERWSQVSAAQLEICDHRAARARHVISLKGEVDVSNTARVEYRIVQLVDSGVEAIVVDLSGLWFIDASGLRSLLACREQCHDHGVVFALAPLAGTVKRVFALTGVEAEFVFESV